MQSESRTPADRIEECMSKLKDFSDVQASRREVKRETARRYLITYFNRKRAGRLDPALITGGEPCSLRTWRYNQAALVFGTLHEVAGWLDGTASLGFEDDLDAHLVAIEALVQQIEFVMQVARPGMRVDEPDSPSRSGSGGTKGVRRTELTFKPKTSKRNGLGSLGSGWRARFWAHIPTSSRFWLPMAVLSSLAPRAADIARGVSLLRTGADRVQVTLHGSKRSETTGLDWRIVEIDLSVAFADSEREAAVRHLAATVPRIGDSHEFRCPAKALGSAVSAVGRIAFPRHKYKVSTMSFRHANAGDLKSGAMDRTDIAAVMSHRSTRTSGTYGRPSSSGRHRPVSVKVVEVSGAIRKTHNAAPDWSRVRDEPASKSTRQRPKR